MLNNFLRKSADNPALIKGFSLIEVALAIGLVAFALVALLSLIPTGLSTSRQSIAETRASELAEQMFATLRRQPFERIECFGQTIDARPVTREESTPASFRFFADENGDITPGKEDSGYEIRVTLSSSTAFPSPDSLAEARVHVVPVTQRGMSGNGYDFVSLISNWNPSP